MADIKAERDAIRAEQTAAQQEYDYWNNVKTLLNRQDVNTTEQTAEEQSADANLSVAENETLQPGQTVEETTAAKQEKQPQYPVDESGEPLWYEMTGEQFDVAMTELGDTADAFIADKIKEAQKATEKAEKAKPKSTEFAKRKAEQQAITAEKAAAQKAYDYWTAQQARRAENAQSENLEETNKKPTFTEKETSYERKELVGDDNRGVGEGEQRDDVQTDAGAAAVDSRVSQGDSEMQRRKVDGNRGEGRTDTSGVLGSGLESEQSDTGRRSGSGNDVAKVDSAVSTLLRQKGVKHTIQKVRISTPEEFHSAISKAKSENPNGWMVDVHGVDEYAECTLLITDDGLSGVAVTPTGDIVSLFSAVKGDYRMQKLIPMAVALGGNKLDCYVANTKRNLANMYSGFGFKPANKIPFNPQYAPEDFVAWAEEHPNKVPLYVATMYYVGEPQETITNYNADVKADLDAVPTIEDYDAAIQERDALLASELSKVNAANTPEAEIEVSLSEQEASVFMEVMGANAVEQPIIELNPSNWVQQFGADGKVSTPLGEVKMGNNQIAKLFEKGRNEQFGMIKPTLETPLAVIEVPSEATEQETERASSLLFVKTFLGKNGEKVYYFKSVTVKKDGMEVSVSSHYDRPKRIKEALKNGKLLYRFDGGAQTEYRPADTSVAASRNEEQGLSDSKDSEKSPITSELGKKVAAAEQTTKTPAESSNLSENEVQNATSSTNRNSNLSKNKADSTKKLLNEAEYINLRLNYSFENRKDKTLSRKDWENTDEYIEIYNNVADEYPAYIANLGKSGELQNMFDKGTVSERIKIQNAIETAGYSVPDFIDRENVNKEAREKREARRKEKMRETMNTLGIDPDTGKLKQLADTEERYRESEEPVSRQKQTGIPYRLSGELDENGHPFVLASDGTTIFGEIRADSGLQPAPIKLSRGIQDENGKGYGLLHIEANHGEEIRKAGFSSVNDFVSFIAHNYDKDNIRVGKRRHNGNITYLLQVTDSHDNTLFIEMSRDGSYWNVNSAGVFRKKYSNKKETVVKTEPQQPNNAISAGSSLSENEESGITSSEPNGEPPVSNSKYSKESSNVQEPSVHRAGEEAGSRDIIDMTEEELAEIRAKEREKIDRIFGKEYLDNVAEAVEKRKAERKAVVSKAARELRSELTASPDIVLVSDLKDIPEEDLQGKTPQEAIRRMRAKGWYTPGNGKVYINLSMHSTAEDVKATILHEAVAHKGLRALLGEESFGALCDAVYRSMPKKRQKAYEDTYKKIYPNTAEAELRRIIADEYMARLAEGGVRQSIPQRIISAIREFLRSIGIDLNINDADIRHLLAQSYKNMQEADAVTVVNNSALLARLRKAAEETHIKSEAESLYRLGDNNKTFSERVNKAVENKGTVMPNLAEENLKVINIPKHKYKGSVGEVKKQAEEDARKKYQGKTLYYDNYGTAFDYTISGESIEKSISKKATDKSTNIGIHIAVLNRLDEVIANSIEVEEHPDYKKGADEERRPENGYNANTLIHRFYGAIKIDGIVYRVKTTMKESRSAVEGNKQYSYEVTNVERLNADALSRSNGVGGLTSSREDALPLAKIIEKETKSYEKGKKILEASRESDIRFRMDNDLEAEEQAIIERAKANGTYMKAPNGEPTKLTPKQWVQVRTKAFKEWFGDWEKAARIEKLRASKPVEITGKEVTPSDDLKQYKKNALEYGKNLRSEYTNKDTGETISLTAGNSRGGIREILQHDYKDVEHLQSIAAIPHIIENSIFIDEQPNEDLERYPGVKSFSYYVCGLKIGGVDYTVKAVIANQNNGERYYDHKLTNIEKGELLSIVPTIQKAGIDSKTPYPAVKDKRLLSLLQTNSSKVVDENGEPMVVYHGTPTGGFNVFDNSRKQSQSYPVDAYMFASNRKIADGYAISLITAKGEKMEGEAVNPDMEDIHIVEESTDYFGIRYGAQIDGEWIANSYAETPEQALQKVRNVISRYYYRRPESEVKAVFVSLKNPLVLNSGRWRNMREYISTAKERGCDGVLIHDIKDPAIDIRSPRNEPNADVAAFYPTQIKSATDNTGSFSSENADIRFRMDNDLEEVNRRFNEELERYQQGKMSKNEMFHLGLPNGVMSIFLPNLPIVMRQRVVNKGANKKHNVEVSSIINMPQKISEPILVFKKDDKSLSILSEMKDKIGRNVFVALDLSSEIQDGGRYIEVNDVTTVHGRRIENIIRPINENNSLQWVDKKKALEWFSSASPNVQQEITSQELKTASNIIKNFENPNFETGKNTEDIRFRLDTPEERQVNIAAQASDKRYEQTDKVPEIDYDMPAVDVAEQVSAKAAIEPLYRLDVFDKDFASEIAIQEAMQQCVSINSNNPPFTVNMAYIYGMYRVLFCMSIK